ncbi:carbonic anhydrase 3-like [Acanthaster planci]|uniref:Carbonic anhydrase n=1 Tax=Acanthaster planci TaxID=133434 RepID=A0A8B7YWQ8_ACAPL|nr:carbonic anhydrase 3-like [Acanthaster planci]
MQLLLFVSGLCAIIPFVHTVPWGYPETKPGTDYWPKIFPLYCSGLAQSPINITPRTAIKMTPASFDLIGFGTTPPRGAKITVQNGGLSAQIKLTGDYLMSGGGLPGRRYRAAGIHFHWGSTDNQGSEHTIDGMSFPAEMHLVTYDTRFSTVSEAAYKVDGLAVLGFFLEIQDSDNPGFVPFLEALSKTKYDGNSINLATPFPISNLFPSTSIMQPYFRYRGSLTTPTCNEVVVWTVFKMPIRISQDQLNVFRSLVSNRVGSSPDIPIVNNYRPPQPLNGRKVFHSAGMLRV